MCLECSGLHRRLGVHVSFCRSTGMDKWTYRQLYRCAVGGNQRARLHWKKCGVDPQEKIETKYNSMIAHQYKSALEKDVADACRRGLAALMPGFAPASAKAPATAASADPFADYFSSLASGPPAPARAASTGNLASLPQAEAPPPASASPVLRNSPVTVHKSQSLGNVPNATAPAAPAPAKPAVKPSPLGPLGGLASTTAAVDISEGAQPAPAPAPAPSSLPAGLAGIRAKPGVRKGALGARKVPASSAAAPPSASDPIPTPDVSEPVPAPEPAPAPAPVAAVVPPKPAAPPKPFKPLAPIAPLPVAASAKPAAAPAGGLSGAWAALEASAAPSKPKPCALCSLGLGSSAASSTSAVPAAPAVPAAVGASSAAPATAAEANGSSNGAASPVPVLFPEGVPAGAPVAVPIALNFSSKPKPKASTGKKLGASRVAAGAGADSAGGFGDFDFAADDEAASESVTNAASEDWGWDGSSPAKEPPPPEPVVDDPWAEVGKPAMSSLFAYDCSSMHAASAPVVQPAAKPPSKAQKSLFDGINAAKGDSPGNSPASRRDDPYGSFARDKFAGATSISSSSFSAAMPESAPVVDPAIRAAEEAAEKERRLEQLGISGASGFGSADLESQPSPGKARQLAGAASAAGFGAAKAVGGYALAATASLLSRAQVTSPPKQKDGQS